MLPDMAEYIKSGELAHLLGDQAAMTLLLAKGGVQVFIPAKVDAGHWLEQLIGQDAAARLCQHFATGLSSSGNQVGAHVELPRPSYRMRLAHFRELNTQGLSASKTALAMGVSERAVRGYRRRAREQGEQ